MVTYILLLTMNLVYLIIIFSDLIDVEVLEIVVGLEVF